MTNMDDTPAIDNGELLRRIFFTLRDMHNSLPNLQPDHVLPSTEHIDFCVQKDQPNTSAEPSNCHNAIQGLLSGSIFLQYQDHTALEWALKFEGIASSQPVQRFAPRFRLRYLDPNDKAEWFLSLPSDNNRRWTALAMLEQPGCDSQLFVPGGCLTADFTKSSPPPGRFFWSEFVCAMTTIQRLLYNDYWDAMASHQTISVFIITFTATTARVLQATATSTSSISFAICGTIDLPKVQTITDLSQAMARLISWATPCGDPDSGGGKSGSSDRLDSQPLKIPKSRSEQKDASRNDNGSRTSATRIASDYSEHVEWDDGASKKRSVSGLTQSPSPTSSSGLESG
ncbi:hypothetical protein QBC33DRAFT_551912 [Phialemonium atrogriseum]|uniref:Uncharacterized protein n=1 Tax=Phialemonium atrogriseum TaxID=1093897 RepID=A0AAJ0FGK6_9PEZI|nr:uncharacterized protein QBC33DRAFT_551912 [Phialemonium atrogriseum]KAK1762448.1 hypothetical protein QBC33DRAFT_551912 [Phialemonium atrogriseum]